MPNKFNEIVDILEKLCNHDISKTEAFDALLLFYTELKTYHADDIKKYLNNVYESPRTQCHEAIHAKPNSTER